MTADLAVAAALDDGRAFADLSAWRKIHVHGADAAGWLNDLLTADLSGLGPGRSQRTLLLTANGRIRADVHATPEGDGFLLLQAPDQPEPIDRLLDRYILSSDVALDDRTVEMALLAFPGREPPETTEGLPLRPSVLGDGTDLLVEAGRAEEVRAAARDRGLIEADPDSLEAWRIRAGIPRFPADLSTDSLPHEFHLGDAIAFDKGCYLGQEAVAKVRNLGHPPFVVAAGEVAAASAPGDEVVAATEAAGVVTSAAARDGSTAVIVRVRWAVRDASLALRDGSPIRIRRSAPA
ncbi:MAG: YgfZ/GcvT domain-containing protein [Actinomycetota bacterium]